MKFQPFHRIIIIEEQINGGATQMANDRRGFSMRGDFNRFQTRQVRGITREIPRYRRGTLREVIIARANLEGVANMSAYRAALRAL